MKIKYVLLLSVLILMGCDKDETLEKIKSKTCIDQCKRTVLFQQCLKIVPKGPQTTKYNDWDEVIQKCESSAYFQSKIKCEFVKPECQMEFR